MNKMTVQDIEVKAKRVLVRVDFNVPLDEKTGEITDDNRIRAALPTIEYLRGQGAKVILMSHLGRPKGKVVESMRLGVAAKRLAQILGQPVAMAPDCVGPDVGNMVAAMKPGDVLMLENLRFHAEEEAGDVFFARALARLGDVYVNDAFGAAHRAHASVSAITEYLPAAAGFLMEKEVATLGKILENPARPFAALLGGAKISDKVGMLENIMDKVDYVMVGGGMAATFLKAKSYEVGQSLVEVDMLEAASRLMELAGREKVDLMLPVDVMVADEVSDEAKTEIVPVTEIPGEKRIVDMGPQTINNFSRELQKCKTIFWNGPVGIFEIPGFAGGTEELAKLLAGLEAMTVIGGGSTAEAVGDMGLAEKMTFVSTGGGASLEFLSGEKLPGVEALPGKK
ncbi:MAG TPA: phosphoglycerate kinase [Dehalococcoidia bacterium]|nr:phosphoglycerate kinase [Dehalococcoidia bacterium]